MSIQSTLADVQDKYNQFIKNMLNSSMSFDDKMVLVDLDCAVKKLLLQCSESIEKSSYNAIPNAKPTLSSTLKQQPKRTKRQAKNARKQARKQALLAKKQAINMPQLYKAHSNLKFTDYMKVAARDRKLKKNTISPTWHERMIYDIVSQLQQLYPNLNRNCLSIMASDILDRKRMIAEECIGVKSTLKSILSDEPSPINDSDCNSFSDDDQESCTSDESDSLSVYQKFLVDKIRKYAIEQPNLKCSEYVNKAIKEWHQRKEKELADLAVQTPLPDDD